MTAYIILSILVFSSSFLDLIDVHQKLRRIIYVTLCLFLTLFLSTRLVGPDLDTYKAMYNITPGIDTLLGVIPKFMAITRFEPLYLLLNGLFKTLGASFNIFMLLFSSAFCILFFYSIKRYNYHYFIALTAFLAFGYISGFSAVRQVMAAAIFFYSLKELIAGKRLIYCLWIVVASLFHASAFILLIFAPFGNQRFKTSSIILLVQVSVIGVYSGIFRAIAGSILSHISFLSAEKIDAYLSGSGSFLGTVTIIWMVLLGTCLYYRDALDRLDANFNLFLNILWFGLAVYAVSVGFGEFGRVILYFKLSFIVLLPLLVRMFSDTAGKFAANIIIGLLCIAFFLTAIYSDTQFVVINRYIPYKTWLIHE